MKIKSIIPFCAFCLVAIQFIACQKDVSQPATALPLTASSVAGNFTVASFSDPANQASTFNGFHFTFNENGTVAATKDNSTFSGSWRFDDSDPSEIKLNFSDVPLTELNKGWHVDDLTDAHMFLTDDGAGDDANDDNASHQSSVEFGRD